MEDKSKENNPQVGPGDTGESHPSLEGCPVESGGDKLPFVAQCTPVENPIQSEDVNPFKRRDSIPRSPPLLRRFKNGSGRQRSGSCSNLRETTESNASKRKREEINVEAPKMTDIQEVLDIINKLKEDSDALNKEIDKTYKPKKEFKNLASSIALWTKEIERRIEDALGKESKGESDMETGASGKDLESQQRLEGNENKYLRKQIEDMEAKHEKEIQDLIESINEAGVQAQCEKCKEARKREGRRQVLSRAENFENFQEITEEDWKDEVFPRIQAHQGCIWESPIDYALILPCDKNIDTTYREGGRTIEKYGGKATLRRQGRRKGEVARMTFTLGFPDNDGNDIHTTRDIYCPIISDGKTDNEIIDDEKIFQSLKSIKAHALKYGKTKLAIPQINGITGLITTRIMEFLFFGTNIEIVMYKMNDGQGMSAATKTPRQRKSTVTEDITNTKKPKQEALLIKLDGKPYAEVLKKVKEAVNPSEVGVNIKEIKKTRNGELLLTIQNGLDKAEVLRREIKERIPEATASLLVNKRTLHIRDLDEVTTAEEIREAVSKTAAIKPEVIDIRALRPAYGNKQNVTIIVTEADAKKLLQMGKIKIGWTQCRVIERKKELKCFRCWQYGHAKTQCTGPDREHLCLKCGKEGHKAAECKNKPFCIHCNEEGHQTGRCPTNQQTIAGGRRRSPDRASPLVSNR